MAFELFCAYVLALGFAVLVAFAGYRFFLVLLPIWGFFFGFMLGAQTVQALFSQGPFATVTSWVVAFFVGALFAVLSYLFYMIAVALFSASIGYGIGVALMGLFNADFVILTWIVAIVLAVVVAFVVLRFNIQKYVIIIATALLGGGIAAATIGLGFAGMQYLQLAAQPLKVLTSTMGFWGWLIFLAMAIGGAYVQWRQSSMYTIEAYENRI